MRRLFAVLLITLSAVLPALSGAGAADEPERHIDVVQVEGNIDPVVSELISESLRDAARSNASLIIYQVDSRGALDVDFAPIEAAIRRSPVPVAAWVGPAKSSARGAAAALVAAAHVSAVSTSSNLGPILPRRLDETGGDEPAVPPGGEAVARRRLRGSEAVKAKVVDFQAPTLGDLLVGLDGRTVRTADGPVKLSTAKMITTDDGPRRTANQPVRFLKLSTFAGVQHSLTSPAVAYILLLAGLGLMIFEFFTLGIGLAGVTGALSLVGAFFGFSHLPVEWWAAGLILLSFFGFSVDVQATHLGFWSGVGVVGAILGAVFLYGGSSLIDVPWWLVIVGVLGEVLFMLGGMTVAVRNRCAVPTVGRDSMVGEVGETHTALTPDGVVVVRGAPWRARVRRGRKIEAGLPVKVVAVDRLVLEVEPAEAG